jgi:choline-glycine betaine transporter
MFTTTWRLNMVDPVNEMLLVVTIPITIVLLGAIYGLFKAFLETRDDCNHTWSRWSDPQKGDAHPYQTRSCNKCNMHQSRIVQ